MAMPLKKFPSQPRILWLEDHPGLVKLFGEEFSPHYHITQISSLNDLKSLPSEQLIGFDAILLDLELPDGKTTADLIQQLRMNVSGSPILILSNDESLKTRLEMLNNGADDYLWKAMHPEEMLLRIRNAILRHQKTKKEIEVQLGGIKMEPKTLEVELHGQPVELSKIEFQLLMLLIRKFPEPVTLEDLKEKVWKAASLETGTINTFIWKLNKKLEQWQFRLSKEGESVSLQTKNINP